MKDEKGAVYHGGDKCHNRARKRAGVKMSISQRRILDSSDDLAEWLEPLDCIIKPWQFLSSIVTPLFCSRLLDSQCSAFMRFLVFLSRCPATARWKLSKCHELWTCVEKSTGFSAPNYERFRSNRWISCKGVAIITHDS